MSVSAKKSRRSSGGGFGKVEKPPEKAATTETESPLASENIEVPSSFLTSADQLASTEIPQIDDSLPPEERTKLLLKEKYGMKTIAEQQLSAKQLEARKEKQKQLAEWKKKAEVGEDIDIIAMIPGGVQIAIDRFLKTGLAICTILFIAAGGGITVEAWSKTSGSPLPDDVDSYIVNVIEPNFTTGLLVLLGFSVSLGAFATLQLSSGGAQYKESD